MGFPMPRSMTSAPERRFWALRPLSRAKRYGGKRRSRVDTSMVNGSLDPPAMETPYERGNPTVYALEWLGPKGQRRDGAHRGARGAGGCAKRSGWRGFLGVLGATG